VAEVPGLFNAVIEQDVAQLEAQKDKIFVKEGEADEIKNDLRDHLPKSMLLAVDRRDLLELLAMQDAIADIAQDIAGLLVERKMEVPEGMAEPLMRFVTAASKPVSRRTRSSRSSTNCWKWVFAAVRSTRSSDDPRTGPHGKRYRCDGHSLSLALFRPGRQHQAGVGDVLVPVDPVGGQSGRLRREGRRPPALMIAR
jgi:hypothetical protein